MEGDGLQRKSRKGNFSDADVTIMIEDIGRESDDNESLSDVDHAQGKKEVWANIAANVNACGVANRTVEDIKKKWNHLKLAALNNFRGQTKTGGGPPVKPPPFAELVLNVIGDQSDAPHGIEGRSD